MQAGSVLDDDRERTRPERLHQVAGGGRQAVHQAVQRVARSDEHRDRHPAVAPLGVLQRGHRPRLERVAADAEHRVGREHHQVTALHGLDVIRGLVTRAAALLKPGGVVAIEHDDSHGEAVPALLRAAGSFERVEDHRDLTGRPRFATGYRVRS